MSGVRKPWSKASRVRRLFDDNPGEEYTFSDLQTKFPDIGETSLRDIVKDLGKASSLEAVHVYRSTKPAPIDPEIAHLRQRITQLKAQLAEALEVPA